MDQYLGIIMMFGGNFAPRGWANCDGSLLSIAQNTALFSILGTTYGGNGQTTFGLPDLRGRVPIHYGQGPGLPAYSLGQMGGTETVTLTPAQMAQHQHPVTASFHIGVSGNNPNTDEAAGSFISNNSTPIFATASAPGNFLGGVSNNISFGLSGGNQPFSVLQPYLAITFIIALEGIFPSRN